MKNTEQLPDESTKRLFRQLFEWQIELERKDSENPVTRMMIELIDWQLEQLLKENFE